MEHAHRVDKRPAGLGDDRRVHPVRVVGVVEAERIVGQRDAGVRALALQYGDRALQVLDDPTLREREDDRE